MAEWFTNEKQQAEKSNLDALAPERDKLSKDREAVTQGQFKLFQAEVNSVVSPHMNQEFGKHMGAYSKALNALPEAMRQAVAQAWLKEIGAAFGKQYHDNMEAMLKGKNRDKVAIANYAKTRISAVAAGVTEKIVKAYNLAPGVAAKPGPKSEQEPSPTGGPAVVKVQQRPSDDQIDWDRDPDRMLFITGKAFLKGSNGTRIVKWR